MTTIFCIVLYINNLIQKQMGRQNNNSSEIRHISNDKIGRTDTDIMLETYENLERKIIEVKWKIEKSLKRML